ncbi:hypothetical protein CBR_g50142 [Chara braunii]|uniref:Uncharacterized protein n=1 Tax=Chara braunii TaxID=69332 RepID=A0A388M6D8_CHABU|nr:hypothetical protein CBR_g50142 [Chara braunii]|eukprot:GBG90049.1 hypothetical protein CBR_g50142 [Chara braunii]
MDRLDHRGPAINAVQDNSTRTGGMVLGRGMGGTADGDSVGETNDEVWAEGWQDTQRQHEICGGGQGQKERKGDSFRPFQISQHPLQIPWDPSMWEWRATNSQRCPMLAHHVTTKVIYRSLNAPTDMADEMRERWKKKGWLEQSQVGKWTQQNWERACTLLTMLPNQKQAGGLWLTLQMAVPTYQWMAEYSSATDKDCKACEGRQETLPHIWLECEPQETFWEWWGTNGRQVPLHPQSPEHRVEVLVGQLLAGTQTRMVHAYAGDVIRGAFWEAMWAMRGRLLRTGVKGSARTLQQWFLKNLKVSVTADMQRNQNGNWRFLKEAWDKYTDVLWMGGKMGQWGWAEAFGEGGRREGEAQGDGGSSQTRAENGAGEEGRSVGEERSWTQEERREDMTRDRGICRERNDTGMTISETVSEISTEEQDVDSG